MTNLGNCRCIPRQDKDDLAKAIRLTKSYLDVIHIRILEKVVRIPRGEISFLEDKIRDTPTCKDGDIRTGCTCISNHER